MSELLNGLNPQQREAAEQTEGPLLILAGAGSGKTRVIVHRIAHLIESLHIPPYRIMAVTFTNKAAEEMRERIGHLISAEKSRRLLVSTFHSAGLRILRRYIHHLGYKNDFVVYDSADQLALIKSCMTSLTINEDLYPPRSVTARISSLKHQLIAPDQFEAEAAQYGLDVAIRKVYPLYQERLRLLQGLDFDDLIGLTIRLFEEVPEVLRLYRDRIHYIMVDEYQDINQSQYRLIQLLSTPRRNLCVVGDDDQSIYAFRGADIENILSFERDFPDAKVVILNQNYRSTGTILSAASAVIKKNSRRKEKSLWTENGEGEPILWKQVQDEAEEAASIRKTIEELQEREERPLSHFCVLYRTNAQSRVIEEAFRRAGIPYFIYGGLRFYERKEIKDLIAYLRLIVSPDDALSVRRVINLPQRGVGAVSLERLSRFAESRRISLLEAAESPEEARISRSAKTGLINFTRILRTLRAVSETESLAQLLRMLVEEISYLEYLRREFGNEAEGRIENILEFIAAADQFNTDPDDPLNVDPFNQDNPLQSATTDTGEDQGCRTALKAFLDQAALVSNGDDRDTTQGGVTLMTLHSAKGLEFPVVFLTGLEEGLFPHSRALTDHSQMEEERRLCYVGMTRAKERLYLISAISRRLYGQTHWNSPSRFIQDLPKETVTIVRSVQQTTQKKQRHFSDTSGPVYTDLQESEAGEYPVGTKVRHRIFGTGKVQRCEGEGEEAKVTVTFLGVGTKKLAIKFAKLEKYV
ncbi:MAG: UvrD-helicase domain-containing protein [Nitrospira sp.]|nr:ATP-dependent DNA helicase PcrA [Candidatus Manganitrophaceae bacterium]HIL34456.1 ATP-dependent DNA helicase PcrA [Candidatus Manganitrophaceae bacterium]